MIALLILIDLWGWLLGGDLGAKTHSGNSAYRNGAYEDAIKRYTDAQLDAPEEPRLHYNLGTALYKQRQFDKAAEEFQRASGLDDARLAADAHYNFGNARFRKQDLPGAIEAYTKALELSPPHQDAKYNLELARKLLKQNAQNQQQQPQPQQGQQNNQQNQDQQKSSDQKDQQQQQQAQSGAANQQKEDQQQQAEAAQARQPGKMTKEEAQAMLDALQERERASPRRPLRASRDDVTIDW
jgi:tetratricopeptide (TPR) repeat protein